MVEVMRMKKDKMELEIIKRPLKLRIMLSATYWNLLNPE